MTYEEKISILSGLNKEELIFMILDGWYIPDEVILKLDDVKAKTISYGDKISKSENFIAKTIINEAKSNN